MSLSADVMVILSSPQWDFVYHFIVLLGVLAALGIAYGHWRRTLNSIDRRLVWGMLALLATRLFPLMLSVLPQVGPDAQVLLPPLERALDTVALAIIGWAFVLLGSTTRTLAAPFLWTNIGLAALGWAALTRVQIWGMATNPQWLQTFSWQRYVWAGWQLLLFFALAYAVIRTRYPDRRAGVLLAMFLVGAIGQILEMVFPLRAFLAPAWERLANFLLYPLLAVATYYIALDAVKQKAAGAIDLLPTAGNVTEMLRKLFAEGSPAALDGQAEGAERPADAQEAVAARAVTILARALGVEQAAIGLLEDEAGEQMRLVAIFNPQRKGRGEFARFPLDAQLAIRRALRRQETVQATGADDILQLKFLYALMGCSETGPLVVHPLIFRGRAIGAFIAGNATSKRNFSEATLEVLPTLSGMVAQLLATPKVIHRLEKALEEREQALAMREKQINEQLEILDRELQQERESAHLFAGRVADLEDECKRRQIEAERLARRLAIQEEETRRSQQEAAALAKKVESLARTKVGLEDEIRGYREQIEGLERLLGRGEGSPRDGR